MNAIIELRSEIDELQNELKSLVAYKKSTYNNMPIDSPMTAQEKELNRIIALKYARINACIKLINDIKKNG